MKELAIDNAFEELRELEEDTLVYRGSSQEFNYKIGDKYTDEAYISTSRDRKLAETFIVKDIKEETINGKIRKIVTLDINE